MVQEKVFTKVLNARVVLILSSFLLGVFFITPIWGMDPSEEDLPLPEKLPAKKKSGLSKKFADRFTSKKSKDKKQSAPPPESTSPGRKRADTVQPNFNVEPQLHSETPGRKRAYTNSNVAPPLPPETPGRQRANTNSNVVPLKRPSLKKELTNSQKPPQPQVEPTFEKRLNSISDWKSALTGKGLGTYRTLIIDIPAHNASEQLALNQLFQEDPSAFASLLSKFPKITILSLSGLPLGEGDLKMKGLVDHLKSMPLTHLSIMKCGLKETEMKYLSSILLSSTLARTLKELNVSKNDMGDAGVQAFLPGLSKNCSLTHLDMSCNSITHVGVEKLVKSVEKNTVLRKPHFNLQEFSHQNLSHLNLSHNKIEDQGAQYLTQLFTILSDVNVNNNRITGHGIKRLLEALNTWTPPTLSSSFQLHLQYNTYEITDNFDLKVFELQDMDWSLIQGRVLGLFGEADKLYCKYVDRDIREIPASNDLTQGLPLDVLKNTSAFIKMHFEDQLPLEMLQEQLNKIKTQLIIYTSTTGFTPILNNLDQYNDLLMPLPAKRVDVFLPDKIFYRFPKSPCDS